MSKRILMLRTEKGSPNGIDICTFIKDKEYVVSNKLAHIFVDQMNIAIEVIHSNAEVKMISEAPSNKSISLEKVNNEGAKEKPVKKRGRPRIRGK